MGDGIGIPTTPGGDPTALRPAQKPTPPNNGGQSPAAADPGPPQQRNRCVRAQADPTHSTLNWARVRSDHLPSRPRCRSCSPQETKNTEEMPKKDEAKVKAKDQGHTFLGTNDRCHRAREVRPRRALLEFCLWSEVFRRTRGKHEPVVLGTCGVEASRLRDAIPSVPSSA
ncbi:hypothetical protein B0H14DRAFT_1218102 [Mycena olivaceomarginata]|nr:hypothetical protein B0H14DRAFT_1218102 [Mycena olivaceomarginata]